VSHSRAWILVCTISFSLLPGALAQAQGPDTLAFIISPSARITDSVTASMPASHRSAPEGIDQPAGVIYCPEPRYPGVLAEFGFDDDVDLQFVIDTSGRRAGRSRRHSGVAPGLCRAGTTSDSQVSLSAGAEGGPRGTVSGSAASSLSSEG